jgi:hypothetical protein
LKPMMGLMKENLEAVGLSAKVGVALAVSVRSRHVSRRDQAM